MSDSSDNLDPRQSERAARRAERASQKAARAQARADAARQRAIEAARAGGIISDDPPADTTQAAEADVADDGAAGAAAAADDQAEVEFVPASGVTADGDADDAAADKADTGADGDAGWDTDKADQADKADTDKSDKADSDTTGESGESGKSGKSGSGKTKAAAAGTAGVAAAAGAGAAGTAAAGTTGAADGATGEATDDKRDKRGKGDKRGKNKAGDKAGATGTTSAREGQAGEKRAVTRSFLSTGRATALLAAATALLLILGGLAFWQGMEARDAAADETAIAEAPTQATDAGKEIVTNMFSYDWNTVDEVLDATQARLTGAAEEEFRTTARQVTATTAKENKASVFATVSAVGVETVHDENSVALLMMVNRMISTEEEQEAQSASSRLRVEMRKVDGEWKLADLVSV